MYGRFLHIRWFFTGNISSGRGRSPHIHAPTFPETRSINPHSRASPHVSPVFLPIEKEMFQNYHQETFLEKNSPPRKKGIKRCAWIRLQKGNLQLSRTKINFPGLFICKLLPSMNSFSRSNPRGDAYHRVVAWKGDPANRNSSFDGKPAARTMGEQTKSSSCNRHLLGCRSALSGALCACTWYLLSVSPYL